MRIISLLIVLLSLTSISFAQNFSKNATVQWGEETKAGSPYIGFYVIGEYDDQIYTVMNTSKAYSQNGKTELLVYDKKMNLLRSQEIELPGGRNAESDAVFRGLGGEIYLTTTFTDKKEDIGKVYARKLNKKSLTLGNKIELLSVKEEKINYFGYYISMDRSVNGDYFVIKNKSARKGKELEEQNFHVFDSSLNKLWSETIEFENEGNDVGIVDWEVSDQGVIHMAYYVSEEKEKKKEEVKRKDYFVVIDGKGSPKTVSLNKDNLYPKGYGIFYDNDGLVICSGLYRTEPFGGSGGTFIYKLNPQSGEIMLSDVQDFDSEMVKRILRPKDVKKLEKKEAKAEEDGEESSFELKNFKMDGMIVREDGGIFILGEQRYVRTVTTTTTGANGSMSTRTTDYYHRNSILVISIDAAGKIIWTKLVPKVQVTANDGGYLSSYTTSYTNGNLYLIFNDNAENLFALPGDKLKAFNKRKKDSNTVFIEVGKDGSVGKREMIFNAQKEELYLKTSGCSTLSDGSFMFSAVKKKTFNVGRIQFK